MSLRRIYSLKIDGIRCLRRVFFLGGEGKLHIPLICFECTECQTNGKSYHINCIIYFSFGQKFCVENGALADVSFRQAAKSSTFRIRKSTEKFAFVPFHLVLFSSSSAFARPSLDSLVPFFRPRTPITQLKQTQLHIFNCVRTTLRSLRYFFGEL